jgi:peptidylprolyl isomerase
LRSGAWLLGGALALTACGGGGEKSSSAQPAPSSESASSTPATGLPTPSAAPSGDQALPGIPAITANATDLEKEPTIAKGTGSAPTGLVIRDLVVGTGKAAVASDSVNVRYEGTLFDGTAVNATWKSGSAPATLSLSGVVAGLGGGIVGMKIGGRREIVIPAQLGYGSQPPPGAPIPPNSVLVFVVDLVSIGSPAAANVPVLPTPSAAPAGDKALPGIPAITQNATDLAKEPKIAKGTGSAPTGLVIRDLVIGTGKAAVASDTVKVRYEGALFSDGTVFDATWKGASAPADFSLSEVVPGFGGGIVGMKIGGRREIVIPAQMGYGSDSPQGSAIPPNSVLVFVVDLVSIS